MITGDNDMENTNLEALNALIEKVRAGEGTAESNLEALNMLCVLSGGTGKAKSNLEALNELLTVFEAAKPEQVKSVSITVNGMTAVTPDDGHVLSSVNVDVNVPSKPEQAKTVTITENGTTEITPDEGYTLSGASVSVNVPSGSDYNVKVTKIAFSSALKTPLCGNISEVDLSNVSWLNASKYLRRFFESMTSLKKITWGNFMSQSTTDMLDCLSMFDGCSTLESVDLSSFGTKIIIEAQRMFEDCRKLKNIIFGSIKFKPVSYYSMFGDCRLLETIDTSVMDHTYEGTQNVERMFYNCQSLKSIDLSNLYTHYIDNASNMFYGCNSLTNVTFENGCFSNATIKSLDLSYSPLTHDCAVDIFNKLAPRDNSPTIKLSTTTKGYLTEDEIAVATAKGWVVS